jgi:hypothetical protein
VEIANKFENFSGDREVPAYKGSATAAAGDFLVFPQATHKTILALLCFKETGRLQ